MGRLARERSERIKEIIVIKIQMQQVQPNSRHQALKSHHLPPTQSEAALRAQPPNQVNLRLRSSSANQGNKDCAMNGNNFASGPIPNTGVHSQLIPSQVATSLSNGIQNLAQVSAPSPKSAVAYCQDHELFDYRDEDFQTVNRVIELCFHRSSRAQSSSRDSPAPGSAKTSTTNLASGDSAIIDKLTLIKCYEQTMRNQGLNPAEDSRIYKLLFRVVHESETYITQNKQFIKSREMAKLERLSLMQNQLNSLKLKSQQRLQDDGETKHHHVSWLTQPEMLDGASHYKTDSLTFQIQNKMDRDPAVQSQPQIAMDTISQAVNASNVVGSLESRPTDQSVGTHYHKADRAISTEKADLRSQAGFQKTQLVTKLELKGAFQEMTHPQPDLVTDRQTNPNPISDRQINREIADLHLQQNLNMYPSFDNERPDQTQFTNEALCAQQPLTAEKKLLQQAVTLSDVEVDLMGTQEIQISDQELPNSDQHLRNPPIELNSRNALGNTLTASSDAYIMTTTGTHIHDGRLVRGSQTGHLSSVFINTVTDDLRTHVEHISRDQSIQQVIKPQSLSFCHENESEHKKRPQLHKTQPMRENSNSNRSAILPSATSGYTQTQSRYQIAKPPADPKKTLAFKFKVDYSIVFKVFRAWKEYQSLRKRQKNLKKVLLNGLVKAINKHEQLLTVKAFRALKTQKKYNARLKRREDRIRQLVEHNIKAFYFRLMLKKQKQLELSKNLTALAQSHFRGCIRQRIMQEWHTIAKNRRDKLLKVVTLIKRKPQSAIVLINFIGFSVMPVDQQSNFDILDFYSYCSIKKRFKPDSQRLAHTIELALKQQLRRIMTAWIAQKDKVARFKRQLKRNTLRRVFLALDKNCALSYRLKLFAKRREGRLQEQVIIALLQNLERVRRLALSSQLTKNLHQNFQQRQYFCQWRQLHNFYLTGSLLRFEQKSTPLKVLHLHKKRIFNRLKRYCQQKREVNRLIFQHRQKHLVQMVLMAYKAWGRRAVSQKTLRQQKQKVETLNQNRMRKVYFKGMVRACMIRQRQRAYREYVLMAKGVQGLAQRVDYRRMQTNLKQICDQTYLINLTKRAYKALKSRKFNKDNNYYMLVRAKQFLAARSMQVLFYGWKDAIVAIKQRKMLMVEVERFYNKKVYRRVYQSLQYYTGKRLHLASLGAQVRTRINQRIYRQVLITMICKYAKRVNLKQLQRDFTAKRDRQIEQGYFFFLVQKYRSLKLRERHISSSHQLLVKKNLFYSWLQKSKEQASHNYKIQKVLYHGFSQTKACVFREWFAYTQRKQESRKMKAVSSYFFICKVLRKTILALRMNSIQMRFNQASKNDGSSRLLRDAFGALKQHWDLQRRIKHHQQKRFAHKAVKALYDWQQVAKKSILDNRIVKHFQARRNLKIQHAFFAVLQTSGIQQSYYLGRLLRAWRLQTHKQIHLAKKQEQVAFVHQQLQKQSCLRQWRHALFESFALNKIAMPYNTTILLKRAFNSLKRVTSLRRKARLFERRSLLYRSMQAWALYQMNEAKIKAMQDSIKEKKLGMVFDAFIDQCLIIQDLRLKAEELKAKTEGIICERSMRHWFNLCKERLHLQPIETHIKSSIREKWLLKVSFSALSRYHQIRKGKNQMYASISSYHTQRLIEKTYRQLALYCEQKKLRRDMADDAELLRRKHLFKRMIRTANFLSERSEALADEHRENWLGTRVIAALRDYATKNKGKMAKVGKADLFSQVRLKLNVFRALAIHTLRQEKAKLAFRNRRQVKLLVQSNASQSLAAKLTNMAPVRGMNKIKKKRISKKREITITTIQMAHVSVRNNQRLQDLLRLINGGKFELKKVSRARLCLKNRSKRISKPKRVKLSRFNIKPSELESSWKFEIKSEMSREEMMIVMEEMLFEEEEDEDVAGPQVEEVFTQVTKKPSRGLAVKSAVPLDRFHQEQPPQLKQRQPSPLMRAIADSNARVGGAPGTTSLAKALRRSFGEDDFKQSQSSNGGQPSKTSFAAALRKSFDIEDLKRSQSSQEETVVGIEACYEETFEERKHTAEFNDTFNQDQAYRQNLYRSKDGMEPIGQHLNKLHAARYNEPVIVEDHRQSLSFVEDKWDNLFAQQKDQKCTPDDDDQQHTMPSFREGNDDDEKTLSVIYDDTDLTRDPTQSFSMQQRYISQDRVSVSSPQFSQYRSRPPMSVSDSINVTAEPKRHIISHTIIPESPQYETNEPMLPPPRPGAKLCGLRVSNQEIQDEMALYSSVQSYEKARHFTPKTGSTTKAVGQGSDWLKRNLQSRLHQSGQALPRRSGSWKPHQTLNSSMQSGHGGLLDTSLRSSSQTRVTASAGGKDNKVMQKIVENLSYLNLSRDNF